MEVDLSDEEVPGVEGISIEDNPVTELVLSLAIIDGVPWSDLKIEGDCPVMINLPAGWARVEDCEPLSQGDILKGMDSLDASYRDKIRDGAISTPIDLPPNYRLRLMFYSSNAGQRVGVAVRRQPVTPLPFALTGLPREVRTLIEEPRGLLLLAGATSSGKTSTIASLLQTLNETPGPGMNVVAIEDPIEYRFKDGRCSFTQREVGVDVRSFSEGARESMRMSPNVVMIGEIRDRDTAEAAFNLAESGHLVIASVHGESSVESLGRLINFFPAEERDARVTTLGVVLVGVIWQMLLPSKDGKQRVLAAEVLHNLKNWMHAQLNSVQDLRKIGASLQDNPEEGCVSALRAVARLVAAEKISDAVALRALGYSRENEFRRELAEAQSGRR